MRVGFNSRWVSRGLTVVTCVFVGALLLLDHQWPPLPSRAVVVWLAVCVLVIVVADSRPITIVNGRKVEPVGMTVCLAMAMTVVLPGGVEVGVSPGYLAIAAALATAVAAGVRWVRHGQVPVVADIAMRAAVTGLVAYLMTIARPGGPSLQDALVRWSDDARWVVALALVLLAAMALGFQMVLWSYERAAFEHTVVYHALTDELKAVGSLGLGVISAAVSTALATRVVGPWALVIFTVPLVLLMMAVRRESKVLDSRRQTVWALSRLTDQAGFTDPGHAARVARLAVLVGRQVGMSEPDLRDLEYAALLHDLGQLSLQRPIPGGATTHTSALDQRRVAMAGSALLARTEELSMVATVVAHHATPYWRNEELGQIPLGSRILRVVNAYDDLVGETTDDRARVQSLQRLRLSMGYDYDPVVLRELCRVLRREGQISAEDMLSLELWPSRAEARA
ncbi:MAG: HD domain-containing phosphohydrolase [Ornithinimicrobium sp.]